MQTSTHWKYKPGQYIFINCPHIARFEWHPFTLTSCPEEAGLSVHIKSSGTWTSELHKLCDPQVEVYPTLHIDGPFGAPSDQMLKFKRVVLIAAGIGATAFISFLKSIASQLSSQEKASNKPRRVHFFWICREQSNFSWFSNNLRAIESNPATHDSIEITTFFTSTHGRHDLRSMLLWFGINEGNFGDMISGLHSKSYWGRPDFNAIFDHINVLYNNKKNVGVFFCGPPALSDELSRLCKVHNGKNATTFIYFKERF